MSTPFPSLRITADRLEPKGAFAVAQAAYLQPDPVLVDELHRRCREGAVGVVAHFYMDAELQGVLSACPWEHIVIADSLKMADAAVEMAKAGMKAIVVLGVDFMSENARAVLDAAGFADVDVYRLAAEPIGCSLAESAESPAYLRWLDQAAQTPRSLHVVYINTSLRTKALAHLRVPTITCTSSNVVQTLLQAASQVPDLHLWYGPDTYMGHNLRTMLTQLAALPADRIRALHPAHDRDSLLALLERFHTFEEGACVVHHLFGGDVVRRVREQHADALYTAHLEVPGEMFELAVEASHHGRGVVGSTSDILRFITARVQAATAAGEAEPLRFVLGTESGMITAIVDRVRAVLRGAPGDAPPVDIVFPVASEAVSEAPGSELRLVPGVPGGEGCSTAGGCATCPYMKMNHLDALLDVVAAAGAPRLDPFRPETYREHVGGRPIAEVGSEPILHMRHFQTTGALPDALIDDVIHRVT